MNARQQAAMGCCEMCFGLEGRQRLRRLATPWRWAPTADVPPGYWDALQAWMRGEAPNGYVLVPIEPTEEMILAAQTVVLTDYSYAPGTDMSDTARLGRVEHINECSAADIYQAMIAAARITK